MRARLIAAGLGVSIFLVAASSPPALWARTALDVALDEEGTGLRDVPAEVSPLMSSSSPLAGAVDPTRYRVGPGDVFQLHMWGRATRSYLLVVGPEGFLAIPGSGVVAVDGLTLEAARARVLARVRESVRDVGIDVRLAQLRRFRVLLTGQVDHPGVVEVTGSSRASDVLTADSLLTDASRRDVRVLHRDGTVERADFDLLVRTGDAARDPWLRDGDVIWVPVARAHVYAAGAVASPGRVELAPGDSVSTLLRLVGGALPPARRDRALLLHWSNASSPESIWVSLDDPTSGLARPLDDRDRLYVFYSPEYRQQHEAAVLGEIVRAGSYPIVEGRTHLSELIEAAGGFREAADLSAIRLHRANPSNRDNDLELDRLLRMSRNELTASEYEALRTRLAERREDYRVDWNSLRRHPGPLDVLLRDGDVVWVDRLVSTVRVDGEVRSPAMLAYSPGLSVSDYVAQAGGYSARAWRGKVRVTRAVTGQTLLARGVRQLGPGDFIWVPEKPDVTAWQLSRDMLTALAQVATVIIAIRSIR